MQYFRLIIYIFADATQCAPLSYFKIDCNYCRCSSDGYSYSCSNMVCFTGKINRNDFSHVAKKIKRYVKYNFETKMEKFLNDKTGQGKRQEEFSDLPSYINDKISRKIVKYPYNSNAHK